MPRRKGHGIPPTKRVKVEQHSQQQNPSDATTRTTYVINNSSSDTLLTTNKLKRNCAIITNKSSSKDGDYNMEGNREEKFGLCSSDQERQSKSESAVVSNNQNNSSNHKYLHKKFKKMASTILSPEETSTAEPIFNNEPSATVNCGQRVKGVLCSVPVNNNSNSDNSYSKINSTSNKNELLDNSVICNDSNIKTSAKLITNDSGTRTESPSGRYKCGYCELPCAKPSVLQKHIRAHTNERPYPCRPCGFAFKTKSNLYKHRRSRTHIRKVEETGIDEVNDKSGSPLTTDDNGDSSNEEDEVLLQSNSILGVANTIGSEKSVNCHSRTETPPDDTLKNDNDQNDKNLKTIYKPKFHTASIYLDNKLTDSYNNNISGCVPHHKDEDKSSLLKQHPNLVLKMPSVSIISGQQPNSSTPQSTPSPFTSGSSPSPEFLQRHITKLISENQAIVETMDPLWPKKFLHRSNSREAPVSPLSTSPTPAFSDVVSKKGFPKFGSTDFVGSGLQFKSAYKDLNLDVISEYEKLKQNLQSVQSKLALALMRPQVPTSPSNQPPLSPVPDASTTPISDPQPLNLSTNNNNGNKNIDKSEIPAVIYNRKRSYSEGFPCTSVETKCDLEKSTVFTSQVGKSTLRSHLLEEAIKLRTPSNNNAIVLQSLTASEIKQLKSENPESSIIKDLLLNTRQDGSGGITTGMPFISGALQPHDLAVVNVTSASIEHSRLNVCEQRYNSQSPLICQFCNLSFKNAQTLQTHQNYHCKEYVSVVPPRLSHSPKHSIGGNKHIINTAETLRSSPAKERWEIRPASPSLTSPPFPSPGPLLGNTPLVDNNIYSVKNVDRQIKHTDNDNNNNSKSKKSKLNDGLATPVVSRKSSSPLVASLVHQQQIHHQELFRSHQESRPASSGTLRSLEELSKCPMMSRGNSLQMFGGEVQILDYPSGETKTLRIEPSNRNSSSEMQLISKENDSDNESLKIKESSHSPHIVVTIAKTGLHSGGTIVQLPQPQQRTTTTTTTATAAAVMVVNGNEIRTDDCRPCAEEVPTVHCKKYGSDPISKYPETNKLIIPIIPNISVPGIPPLVVPFGPLITVTANNPHGRHQPQPSHPHLQTPGISVINPLTNITGYNPLTLPTVSPDLINSNNSNSNSNGGSKSSQYGGGIVTIWHGGKAIPYVPGMPGPQTLVHTTPITVAAVSPSSVTPTTTSSESMASIPVNKQSETSNNNNNSHNTNNKSHSDNDKSTKKFPVQIEDEKVITSKFNSVNNSNLKRLSTTSIESQQCSDKNFNPVRTSTGSTSNSVGKPPVMGSKRTSVVSPLPVISIERVSSSDNQSSESKSEKKFLRPTSLPLKPGTFIPKRHTLSTPNNVLPLISPETPRPRKSYGQLYLNGHAYTYLGLKCSTRVFFCTLNKPQPIYVPLTPEHCNISMYSNWKVCSDADPNPFGLDPGKAMRYYDSRHRQSGFTIAQNKSQLTVTHSSQWINGSISDSEHSFVKQFPSSVIIRSSSDLLVTPLLKTSSPLKSEKEETVGSSESEENTPKRVKIFDGGFESNEEYIYIRGRGRGRYVCEECGIRCKKPSMLKKHIRTHTDVRPYTCKQCSFSFKTKGNLTKHMKSKAHYKKCVELGLNPVPTLVDDSCINEELLMKQQAMRADQGLLGNEETDEEEDEDEEDDEEEEEEEDEDEDDEGEGGDNWNSKLEREAACSLLSLSEGTMPAVPALSSPPLSHVRAGLVAIRPSTYPYSFTYTTASSQAIQQPQTPTLTAMTAQREREKVSQNTGLARDLSSDEQKVTMCPAQEPAARLESGSDCVVTSRYYFPSVQNKLLNNEKAALVGTSDKNPVTDVESEEMVALNDANFCDTSKDSMTVSSSPSVIPASSYPINEHSHLDSNSAASTPIDLSNKSVGDNNNKPISNSRSQVQTCEAALLLASLCSTVDSLPLSKRSSSHMSSDMMVDISSPTVDDGRNSQLLQAYITERAVKQQTIKQHQSYNNRNNSHDRSTIELSTVTAIHQNKIMNSSDDTKIITSTTPTTNTVSTVSSQSPVLLSSSPSSKLLVTGVGGHSGMRFSEDSSNDVPSVQASVTTAAGPAVSVADSISDLSHPIAKENALDILAKTSLASDAAKKQALKLSSVSSNSISTSSGSPNKKLKAEFLPPSSGPSPSYVSMLEDGRSMCLICNKIFTKPSQMKLHVNIHYFERPFRCESCAVSFRTKGHLQKHQRSVTHINKMSMNSTFGTATTSNPRPFKCDDCKIAFRIHGHLAKHLRSKMHIMKLECLGKLPFGTYAEMERSGINMNDIDTSDCENSLESLQLLAQKLYEKDPTKLGQWDPSEMLPLSAQQQHRSNSSSTSMVVDHHSSLTQHQNYNQQQEHMNDDASSNDEEDNDNENESLSSDVNHFPTSVTGAPTMILNRNNINMNSIPSTISVSEDVSGGNQSKHFQPKVKYHLSSSDNGMMPIMVPTQSPIQQSVHHILKKKIPNNIDSSFSGTNICNRSTSGTEGQYVYLNKMPSASSSVISSSGGVISSVTDYSNNSAGTDAAINTSSLLNVGSYNKSLKFKIDDIQSKSLVTSNIAKPSPGVIGINPSDNTNVEYCFNRNISSVRGTNFVATTSSAAGKMDVFSGNVNISSNSNSSSDLNCNRSVIQRLSCNLDQPDETGNDSSIGNSFICSDNNVDRNINEINVDSKKTDVSVGNQDGSSDKSKFNCSETVNEKLNVFSERTKVNIDSSISAQPSVVPSESITDYKNSASTATSDSLSIENCS